jgi:ribose transport system permease protein
MFLRQATAKRRSGQGDATSLPTGAKPPDQHGSRRPVRILTRGAHRFGLLGALACTIAIFGVLNPSEFLTVGNLDNILGSQAVLLFLALALVIPFTTGEFDLSVNGVLSVATVTVGNLNVIHHWPLPWAILGALVVSAAAGAINAFVTVVVGVESIIVTLGMGTLLLGVAYGILGAPTVGLSSALITLTTYPVLTVPAVFWYGLALTVVIWYVFSFTPLGRYMFFVGASRNVARLAGIRVQAIRAGGLLASSILSGIAGVLLAGYTGSSAPNVSDQYLLPAFAALFLGATCINPGRFNPWGTFIAVYFLGTAVIGFGQSGLVGWIEQVFYGGALVIAVAISRLLGRRAASPSG